MRSIRFGLFAVALCGFVALAAGLQVLGLQREIAAIDAEQDGIGSQIAELRNVMDALLDIETGQRGFQLTGQEPYLEPYLRGEAALDQTLQKLAGLFRHQPALAGQIERIVELAGARQQSSARVIALRRAGAVEEALEITRGGAGKRLMDAFRVHVGVLESRLRNELAASRARESEVYLRTLTLGASVTVLVLALVAGAVGWLSVSIRRLDSLQRRREQEAMHDALTGLPNRRYLLERLAAALAACQRNGRPLALLYFDLDGFKAVNDRLGHEAGDRVLQETATRLRRAVRSADFVARLGGDEFVAVLPETAAPHLLIERLERDLAEPAIPELEPGAVSASIGVAAYPEDGDSPDALLSAADQAMYEVKQRRRAARAGGARQPASEPAM